MLYGTQDTAVAEPYGGMPLYICTIRAVELEANIVCNNAACRAQRVRRAVQPQPIHSHYSGRPSHLLQDRDTLLYFFNNFPTIGGMIAGTASHPIDNYIYGNTSTFGYQSSYFTPGPMGRNWSAIPNEDISQRLTEVLNGYWEASRWMEPSPRADPFALLSIHETTDKPYENLQLSETMATITRTAPMYKASLLWLLTLVLCSGTLSILGLSIIYVTSYTSVSDIFGAVSSMTRTNSYVELPEGGSTLDGTDCARLIRDSSVRLGDVQEGKYVGLIALRSIAKADVDKGARLEKGRLFR